MTDSTDVRRVQDIIAKAKKLGFKVESAGSNIYLYSTSKGFPCSIYGKSRKVFCAYDLLEVRGFLNGFEYFQNAVSDIDFDLEEYKKRVEDKKLLDILKGEE